MNYKKEEHPEELSFFLKIRLSQFLRQPDDILVTWILFQFG